MQDPVPRVPKGTYKRCGQRVIVNAGGDLIIRPTFLESSVLEQGACREGAGAAACVMRSVRSVGGAQRAGLCACWAAVQGSMRAGQRCKAACKLGSGATRHANWAATPLRPSIPRP